MKKNYIFVGEGYFCLPLPGQPFKRRPGEKTDVGEIVLIVPISKRRVDGASVVDIGWHLQA